MTTGREGQPGRLQTWLRSDQSHSFPAPLLPSGSTGLIEEGEEQLLYPPKHLALDPWGKGAQPGQGEDVHGRPGGHKALKSWDQHPGERPVDTKVAQRHRQGWSVWVQTPFSLVSPFMSKRSV